MRVLVIGSGGREHALVRSLLEDPSVTDVRCAPGNAGIAQDVPVFPLDVSDANAAADLAAELGVDLVVVGPELPLTVGAADAVRAAGIACFGPSQAAAALESSKAFAKDVMAAAGVPTAMAHVCADLPAVERALDAFGAPHVVKADGLAAGKGVVVTDDRSQALAHAVECLAVPGSVVLVEEYLDGPEVSLFAVCDGADFVLLDAAQDFKRVGDDDAGPNTGGMGSYCPLPWIPDDLADRAAELVVRPVLDEMARRGVPFGGVLYVGLALTTRGLRVVEFNVRFGDPEAQSVLARLASPLGELLWNAATGSLALAEPLRWRDESIVTVVLAAPGYPGRADLDVPITGIERAEALAGVSVLHAGTAARAGGLVTAGGRVLGVVARGADLADARRLAYEAVDLIELPGAVLRRDIAARAVAGLVAVPGAG